MDTETTSKANEDENGNNETENVKIKSKKKLINMTYLATKFKHRHEVLKVMKYLNNVIKKKNCVIKSLKMNIKHLRKKSVVKPGISEASCQTENNNSVNHDESDQNFNKNTWTKDQAADEKATSIADMVKEVAENAVQQTGMVYVESAGMYYDYKSGYYYNPELSLYYHTSTNCYYYYSEDQKQFVYHSHADTSNTNNTGASETQLHSVAKTEKSRKNKKKVRIPDEMESLTAAVSAVKLGERALDATSEENTTNASKKRRVNVDKVETAENVETQKESNTKDDVAAEVDKLSGDVDKTDGDKKQDEARADENGDALEDGECSETDGSESSSSEDANSSTDDESVSKHHPPCMRIIVRETKLPKLKIGSLFMVTKDGGTLGREGAHHAVLINDTNVSRHHLRFNYNDESQSYSVTDLGSQQGTFLNGKRISVSKQESEPAEVVHGSIIQVGETKLLCHIHPGSDTCGHCEPGLLIAEHEKTQRSAFSVTPSMKRQYKLELQRLKNKYAAQPAPRPAQESETSYQDRAKDRRETVGSMHHSEKTEQADFDRCLDASNKGFKMLSKMGWKTGEGLGKAGQGDVAPVELVSNSATAGLGSGGLARPAVPAAGAGWLRPARPRLVRPPAAIFAAAAAASNSDDGED